MFEVTRTAWQHSRVSYNVFITEEDIESWNKRIKQQNPNFVDLTEKDIIDAWNEEDNERSRYLETIWWYNMHIRLFDLIRDDINDWLWESEPYVERCETVDYEDEYYYGENENKI